LMDWSYNLLTADERELFCHLSVFCSGWTLETLQGVLAAFVERRSVEQAFVERAFLDAESAKANPGARRRADSSSVEQASVEQASPDAEGATHLLNALVDKSLVVANGTRYAMLETIRTYAAEKLDALPEREQTHAHHAAYFLSVAEQGEREIRGANVKQV